MPTSFSHIDLCLVTFSLPLSRLLQNCYYYFCHHYRYFHTTLLLNTLLQILSYPGVVELTTQLLILENILWLPLCRINKFGLNTLPSKTVAIPYTCGLSHDITKIIIMEVSTSMTINRASQKCFRQGWPTHGIHHNGTPLSYRVRFWIR